jgi:predicted transcriptional regulator
LGSKRRNGIALMRDILDVCMKGANKTRIVYFANLNFSRLNRYLRVLLGLGFLVEETREDGRVFYRTTPAGVYFLEGCAKIDLGEKDKGKLSKRDARAKPS